MSPTPGTRLGPYQITAAIGAGGMGEVFRARDTKLNRDVAIKVLAAAFADDPERLARFTREAQTLASLNHPNIAAIYGIEEVPAPSGSTAPGSRALVMELVLGDDLSTHIARGPIPIAEALPIARQITEALEAAHDQGIVHRDLKPANIKVRTDGTVKVLDFGLAKAMDPGGASASNPNVSHSPTLTHHGTSAGMIIGTAAYMSPEQAKGKPVDKRADIWAFGVVLFEMLTGKRAFRGEDVSETLAAVLMAPPSMDALPSTTSPRLKRLMERCIDRDLKMRLRDIGEARIEIARLETSGPESAISPESKGRDAAPRERWVIPILVVAVLTLGVLLAVERLRRPADRTPSPVRFELESRGASGLVISPDGKFVAFGRRGDGERTTSLWVRRLDQLNATPIADTDGQNPLAISPDGSWLAVTPRRNELQKVSIGGGPLVTLAKLPRGILAGASWQDNDAILYGSSTGGLLRVGASGGESTTVTKLAAGETSHHTPRVRPGGRTAVFVALKGGVLGDGELSAVNLQTGREARLGIQGNRPGWLPDGHILYLAARSDGTEGRELRAIVRPFPKVDEGQWQVSNAGGSKPLWSPTGREIFYISADNKVMTTPIGTSRGFSAGLPVALFDGAPYYLFQQGRNMDVSRDGQRFLMIKESADREVLDVPIIMVLNWASEMRDRLK